jgi:hypothetical protein
VLDNGLNGVDATSADDAWAVGYLQRQSELFKTLALHWDGSVWSIVPTHHPGASHSTLSAVSALSPSDVWAVGTWFDGTRYRTLAEHWDGTAWSAIPTPRGVSGDRSLLAVAAVSSTDVWAGGYSNGAAGTKALIEHWDGAHWSAVPVPGGNRGTVTGMSVGPTGQIWAVGNTYAGVRYVPLSEHWDGVHWVQEPTPDVPGPFSILRKVAALSPIDVWAAGVAYDLSIGGYETFTEHWDGVTWTRVPSPGGNGPCDDDLSGTTSALRCRPHSPRGRGGSPPPVRERIRWVAVPGRRGLRPAGRS